MIKNKKNEIRVFENSSAEQPRVDSEEQLQAAEKIQNVQLPAAESHYSTESPDAQEAMLPVEVFLTQAGDILDS